MYIKLKNSEVLDLFDVMNKIISDLDANKERITDVKVEYWFLRILKKLQKQYELIIEMRNNYIKELGSLIQEEGKEDRYEVIEEEKKKEFTKRLEELKSEEYELTGIYKKKPEEVFEAIPVSSALKYFLFPLLEESEN